MRLIYFALTLLLAGCMTVQLVPPKYVEAPQNEAQQLDMGDDHIIVEDNDIYWEQGPHITIDTVDWEGHKHEPKPFTTILPSLSAQPQGNNPQPQALTLIPFDAWVHSTKDSIENKGFAFMSQDRYPNDTSGNYESIVTDEVLISWIRDSVSGAAAQTLTWTENSMTIGISGGNDIVITGFADSTATADSVAAHLARIITNENNIQINTDSIGVHRVDINAALASIASQADSITQHRTELEEIRDTTESLQTQIDGLPGGHDAVTVSGTPDYVTLSGQDLVRGQIDLTSDVTGILPKSNFDTTGLTGGGGSASIIANTANLHTLRKFQAKIAAIESGLGGQAKIVLIGDSNTSVSERFANPLKNKFWGKYQYTGTGWQSASDVQQAPVGRLITPSGTSTIRSYDTSPEGSGLAHDSRVMDSGASVLFHTDGAVEGAIWDTLEIYYEQGSGNFRYQIAAEGWNNISNSTGSGLGIISLSHTAGNSSITVESQANGFELYGINYGMGTASGVVVYQAGTSGYRPYHFRDIVDLPSWVELIDTINPDLVIVDLGTNGSGAAMESSENTTPSDYVDYIDTVCQLIQSLTGSDIMILSPADKNGVTIPMVDYNDAYHAMCITNDWAFASLYDLVGDINTSVANGVHEVDAIHYTLDLGAEYKSLFIRDALSMLNIGFWDRGATFLNYPGNVEITNSDGSESAMRVTYPSGSAQLDIGEASATNQTKLALHSSDSDLSYWLFNSIANYMDSHEEMIWRNAGDGFKNRFVIDAAGDITYYTLLGVPAAKFESSVNEFYFGGLTDYGNYKAAITGQFYVNGESHFGGGGIDLGAYQVQVTGDAIVTGDMTVQGDIINQNYGFMSFSGASETITATGAGTYDVITNGTNNLFANTVSGGDITVQGDSMIINCDCAVKLDYSFSFAGGNSSDYEIKPTLNGTEIANSGSKREMSGSDYGDCADTHIYVATSGDVIKFAFEEVAGTTDPTFAAGNVSIVKL